MHKMQKFFVTRARKWSAELPSQRNKSNRGNKPVRSGWFFCCTHLNMHTAAGTIFVASQPLNGEK